MIVFLLGFMGAGKSHLGRQLAIETGSEYIDLDNLVVEQTGMTINQVFEEHGEGYFRELETKILHKISTELNSKEINADSLKKEKYYFIGCGGGTPCFNNNMEWMNNHGLTVWLNPSVNVLFSRLKNEKDQRPLLKQLEDDQLMIFIENKLEERKFFYELSAIVLNDNDTTISKILKLVSDAQNLF
jgi:shikimate kinase